MLDSIKKIELGPAIPEESKANCHIPSRIQADTLFTFTWWSHI